MRDIVIFSKGWLERKQCGGKVEDEQKRGKCEEE